MADREPELTTSDQPADRGHAETATVAPPAFDATQDATGPVDAPGVAVPPNIPGYEFEAELGRGGMGVVFKARNLKLNRPVAIKMILGGRYANPTARVRFLFEAEAIAQLQHPGVVQVYEVGEHDGLPFFALEYVDGGTLADKLRRESRLPARAAARMLATLGDAVAAAHARGIVHRDLKPGNVLLAVSGQQSAVSQTKDTLTADRAMQTVQPKIADFGLAKVGPSDMTASGAVMGTPSYMSPEQAAGKVREVGPPADIWALGVILYECLTGRPPFRGETPMDTLHQVMTSEPARPRSTVADIPRDLETICLKCLAKAPGQRYTTAADFANDLRAYLEGRPIAARPVGSLERGWKWARRRPGAAATLAGSLLALVTFAIVIAAFNVRLHKERDAALRDRDAARIAREQAIANFVLARRAVDVYTKKIVEDRRLRGFGLDEVRREWLRDGAEFYREFARQDLDDPTIEVERARAFYQLAEITATINGSAESLDIYRQAREIQERLAMADPENLELQFDLSMTAAGEAAAFQHLSKRVEARERFDRCIAIRAAVARQQPANLKYAVAHGAVWNNLGQMLREWGEAEQAQEAYQTADRLLGELPAGQSDDPTEDPTAMRVVVAVNRCALLINKGQLPEAEKILRATIKLETNTNSPPDTRAAFGLAWFAIANVEMKTERSADGEKSLLAALDRIDPVAIQFPGVLDFQNSSAAVRMMLGTLYLNGDRYNEAEKVLRTGVDRLEPLTRLEPNSRQYQSNLLSGYLVLAQVYGATGRPREAEGVLRAALTLVDGMLAKPQSDSDYRDKQSLILNMLGRACEATDRRPEAEEFRRRDLAIQEALAREDPSNEHAVVLAGRLIDFGKFLASVQPADALEMYNRAEKILRETLKTDPMAENADKSLVAVLSLRATLSNRGKRFADAVNDRQRVVDLITAMVQKQPTPESRHSLADALERLARAQQAAGQGSAAIATYRRAMEHHEELLMGAKKDPDSQEALASAAAEFGLMLSSTDDHAETEARYRQAIQTYDGLLAQVPDRAGTHVDRAGVCCNLGMLLASGPKRAEALEHYGKAIAALRGVLDDATGTPAERRRAQTYLRNSCSARSTLLEKLKRNAEAAADQVEVVAYWARLPASDPNTQNGLAMALERLGDLHFQAGQLGPAAAAYGQTEAVLERIVARDPKAAAPRARLALVLEYHGKSHGANSEFALAIPYFEKAIALREELVREFPAGEHNQGSLPDLSALLARAYLVTNAPEKGEAALVRVAAVRRTLANANPKVAGHHEGLAETLHSLGLAYVLRSDHKQAETVFQEAAAAWDKYLKIASPADVARRHERIADCFHGLGEARLRLMKYEDAASAYGREAELRQTMATAAIARDGGEKSGPALVRGGSLANTGLALQRIDPARSLEPYTRAIAVLRKVAADDPANASARRYLFNAVGGRANSLGKLKRFKEALPDWDWLLEISPADQLVETRSSRSLVLAHIGEHKRASTEVEDLIAKADAAQLYNLACTLSICSAAAAGDAALAEQYAARSVVLLKKAMAAGNFKVAGRVEHLKADSDLDPVRGRNDFRVFITDLIAAPAGPPIEKAPAPRTVPG